MKPIDHLTFPELYATCQIVANRNNERYSPELFSTVLARFIRRLGRDHIRIAENKLSMMTQEQRVSLLTELGF